MRLYLSANWNDGQFGGNLALGIYLMGVLIKQNIFSKKRMVAKLIWKPVLDNLTKQTWWVEAEGNWSKKVITALAIRNYLEHQGSILLQCW